MALRQTTGPVGSLRRRIDLDRAVPAFRRLSRRLKALKVIVLRRGSDGPLQLPADRTGIRVEGWGQAECPQGRDQVALCEPKLREAQRLGRRRAPGPSTVRSQRAKSVSPSSTAPLRSAHKSQRSQDWSGQGKGKAGQKPIFATGPLRWARNNTDRSCVTCWQTGCRGGHLPCGDQTAEADRMHLAPPRSRARGS